MDEKFYLNTITGHEKLNFKIVNISGNDSCLRFKVTIQMNNGKILMRKNDKYLDELIVNNLKITTNDDFSNVLEQLRRNKKLYPLSSGNIITLEKYKIYKIGFAFDKLKEYQKGKNKELIFYMFLHKK